MLDKKDLKDISVLMDKKFDDFALIVQSGFSEMDKRFDKVEGRLERVEIELSDIKSRLDSIEERLSGLENKVNEMEQEMKHLYKTNEEDFIVVAFDLENLKERVKKMEIRLGKLRAGA